jgi:hypothetical protein
MKVIMLVVKLPIIRRFVIAGRITIGHAPAAPAA